MGRLPEYNTSVEDVQGLFSFDGQYIDVSPPYPNYPDHKPLSLGLEDMFRCLNRRVSVRFHDSIYILPGSTSDIHSGSVPPPVSTTLAPVLSYDSAALYREVHRQLSLPPRPLVNIRGSHIQSPSFGHQPYRPRKHRRLCRPEWKWRYETVTDFELTLDLAETLFAGPADRRCIHVLCDSDTVLHGDCSVPHNRRRTLSTSGYEYMALDSCEAGVDPNPSQARDSMDDELKQWCDRFCADPATLKSFTIHRHVSDFDSEAEVLRTRLTAHLRALKYRGSLHFSTSTAHCAVTIYSPHWINRLRIMAAPGPSPWWVVGLLVLLSMMLWPILWLLEQRYEVIYVQWHPSFRVPPLSSVGDASFTSASAAPGANQKLNGGYEAVVAFGDFWGPAVQQAAWKWRQRQRQEQGMGSGHRSPTLLTRQDAECLRGWTPSRILRRSPRGPWSWLPVDRAEPRTVSRIDRLVRCIWDMVDETAVAWRLWVGWGAHS
ncbi:uncharacterized protein BO95DRAFT_394080 [Aspergillus brunneoviolaceus CBS 621.78]|uniref:Uncharacterized protein n=1 Tax=Aspergillus brunneoviolaceus CBS 621.78 TaxID=1450534 RepID=A0ACD1G2P7_9EURO|nr:hypothetical protein BO95DRAFT_394080 [Aspergillus brunneoviolaceus CBS 621.78]RAH43429.1 hypothetical protein BO95DRAFT_394080 [Aspergillus brunneoviolaceus CBS 621.78]